MHSRTFFGFALTIGLALALASASCSGPTCPAGQQSCGTQNGSSAGAGGDAGAPGNPNSETCPELQAVKNCMDAFCQLTTNPFCTCFKRGLDLGANCMCKTFNAAKFCADAQAAGVDPANYDCPSATSAVATMCIGVQ